MTDALHSLIAEVAASNASDFYRTLWGRERRFDLLPLLTPEHLMRTPLRSRTYKREKGLVKIVRTQAEPFLVQWSLQDLAQEPFGSTSCKRPLVLLTDSHEALEKSLWYYEHNPLPLIGEHHNLPVAAYASRRYGIDSILSDEQILPAFLTELEKEYDVRHVEELTLLGSSFVPENIRAFSHRFPRIRLVLACSETGALANACPERSPEALVFHPAENAILELVGEQLVVTKRAPLVTPIIRYRTGIRASLTPTDCTCGKESYRLL